MAIEFFRRAAGFPLRLAILPGTFNPPTRAHLALAEAALESVDEVLFVLPSMLPHKEYSGVGFNDRMRLLMAATGHAGRYSVGSSEGGLFIEIGRECREAYSPQTRMSFLCGRDAAERIANWDYGDPAAFAKILDEFDLIVAARDGEYRAPRELRHKIHPLALRDDYDLISATQVRERIAAGEQWRHLVPEAIIESVAHLYG